MSELHFSERDPNKGYITNNLLIPKREVNLTAIRAALSFVIGEEEVIEPGTNQSLGRRPRVRELFDETKHHVIVPRAFLSEETKREFDFEWVDESRTELTRVNLPNHIIPRDKTQERALEAMATHRGGTVNLACGKGKTIIALKYAVERGVPALVVVNTKALLHQWMLEIKEHVGSKVKVGRIQGPIAKWKGYPITVAMVKTLAFRRYQWSPEFRRYFGVVFFDEGHHMSAPLFVRSADLFFGERFSLTATASRTDGLEAIYQYHLGPIIYADLNQALIPQTYFHELSWTPTKEQDRESRDVNGQRHHGKLSIMLGTVAPRNKLIVQHMIRDMKKGRQLLVLTHSVEHTREILRLYTEMGGPGNPGLINGQDVDDMERIPVLRESNPVIATVQTAREALNKKILNTLYVLTLFGNSNDLQQAWGRIQREHEGKMATLVRVFVDKQISTCVKQSRDLQKYLRVLQYPSEIIKEDTSKWRLSSRVKTTKFT